MREILIWLEGGMAISGFPTEDSLGIKKLAGFLAGDSDLAKGREAISELPARNSYRIKSI